MNKTYNSRLTKNSKILRKNMTNEEKHLWYDFLKTLPITIHRQKTIGKYIVDFYIADKKLIIELDGTQHYETKGVVSDIERDSFLKSLGYSVLRYSNREVNTSFYNVCEDIYKRIFPE